MSAAQARASISGDHWLVTDKITEKVDPRITSYMSAAAAKQQLVAEGLA